MGSAQSTSPDHFVPAHPGAGDDTDEDSDNEQDNNMETEPIQREKPEMDGKEQKLSLIENLVEDDPMNGK